MRKKRKIWEGRSGEVLAVLSEREGVRKERTESGSIEPGSERMGRQLFSADGVWYERSTVHYRIRHGEQAVPPPWFGLHPHPGLCMGRVVDRASVVILDGPFSRPGSVSTGRKRATHPVSVQSLPPASL